MDWGTPPRLSDRRYATVIVRVLLDEHERLVRGEVLNPEGRRTSQFMRWRELVRAVRSQVSCDDRESTAEPTSHVPTSEPDPVTTHRSVTA